ncbi:MAG: endonuclease MutS2, partial [Phycisphaerae bacterium]|nr:endonuclease MutS2 [Phycisphaerae bacterium]
MKRIDDHTLKVLEFDQVLEVLASFAASDLGRQAARALYPSTDPDWIRMRLAQTAQVRDLLDRGERIPLAGIRDIRPVFEKLGTKQTVFEPVDLLLIADTLAASTRLRQFFSDLDPTRSGDLKGLAERLPDFEAVVQRIQRCIDGDGKVRTTASVKLVALRERIADLEERIRRRFAQIIALPEVRKALENENFLIRHGRPVVAIKAHCRTSLHGTVLDRSNTGATLYIEPDALVEMSNDLEEALFEEKKEVGRILWELTHEVLVREPEIRVGLRTLGLVDLIYAKARFSIAYGLSCPQICPAAQVHLRDARHPLLLRWAADHHQQPVDQVFDRVVPMSPRVGEDFDLLLITGPNTGGKTVLLKTVGLCVLLAQSGCPIPAHGDSRIGVYRQVFADIGDEQSIQESLSTFSAHVRQIVRIMERTGPSTLVLLDELGSGTDPAEGAALAAAILEGLLTKSGHVIATTHLGELKGLAFANPRAENASLQFDTETLQPTYRLLMGTPGSSNAVAIAQRLGMPRQVTAQAKALIGLEADQTSRLLNEVQKIRQVAEQRRQDADLALEQARQMKDQIGRQVQDLKEQEQLLRRQADEAIDRSLRPVRDLVDGFSKKMQSAPKSWSDQAQTLAEQVRQMAASTPLAVRHMEFIKGLRRGDSVYDIPFKRTALVDRIRHNRRTLVVLTDGKQLEVPFDQVRGQVCN